MKKGEYLSDRVVRECVWGLTGSPWKPLPAKQYRYSGRREWAEGGMQLRRALGLEGESPGLYRQGVRVLFCQRLGSFKSVNFLVPFLPPTSLAVLLRSRTLHSIAKVIFLARSSNISSKSPRPPLFLLTSTLGYLKA